MNKQGEWIEANIPEEGARGIGPIIAAQNGHITLSDIGIEHHDSPKFRILASCLNDNSTPFD